jgi:hypothetical protein
MSVTTAGSAVSTQHQATQEQIRLAKLIEDKKHDQPEVQEIVRKVLDIVVDSNQEDALLALYDCDYDYEKAVSLLIEKGHEVANEWRTATNHKLTKKQQQKVATTNNGHRDLDENGQQQQRGNGFTSRGRSRRFQQNGGDSHNANNQHHQQQQENDNYVLQQRQRGGSGYRGRNRGYNRGGYRGTDRNHQQQIQDSNVDPSSLSDTNRRHRGAAVASEQQQQQQQDSWDVGNWNGETLIYSRTAKDDEQILNSDDSSRDLNGQSDLNTQQKSTPEFDPIEAARQIKSVIGIGQTSKSSISDQQQKSKPSGQMLNTKVTPSPPQPRIPQQPVIFTDHFDGGVNKIDVQFGNLDEPSSSSAFYSQSESIPSNKTSQRTTGQSAHISPSIRPTDQPVMNAQQQQQQQQQRILPNQIPSQPSMTIKPVVTPQYAVHQQQQQQINPSNVILQSLFYHHHQQQQQPEPVTLDTSYDPTFSLPSMDFNSPYFLAQQPQTQPRYLVSQAPPSHSQPTASKNAQTPSGSASTTTKKAPAVPPGMFPPTAPPLLPQQPAYSATYGIQQQTGGTTYSTPYDTEHLFNNTFMPLTNVQQTQSPTGAYGSVTPPNQQQQTNNNNENKTMNYRLPLADNLILLQQYQQYALQQSNSQQQGQQPTTHSPGTLNYFLGHPPSGANYPSGHQIMYAQAATAMAQQQVPKQQGQQYNQNNSSTSIGSNDDYYSRGSSSNKEGQYMYAAANQPHHVPPQSAGQQQGVNKQQQQQRPSGNVYNNHQGQQRPFQ